LTFLFFFSSEPLLTINTSLISILFFNLLKIGLHIKLRLFFLRRLSHGLITMRIILRAKWGATSYKLSHIHLLLYRLGLWLLNLLHLRLNWLLLHLLLSIYRDPLILHVFDNIVINFVCKHVYNRVKILLFLNSKSFRVEFDNQVKQFTVI